MSSTSSEGALAGPLTALETLTLEDAASRARVVIAPARGGMVTRFDVAGVPVLFLDVASLVDETKNVRGGNPVLFPSPGPLAGDAFTRQDRSGAMKQHGFARQRAWSPKASSPHEVTLELASDDATRAQFPWDFVVRIRYALVGTTLTVETRVENTDSAGSGAGSGSDAGTGAGASRGAMPFALGFHPYFYVPDGDKGRASIPTGATRAFDNVTKATIDLKGPIDLTAKEVDLHLFDHDAQSAVLERPTDRVTVTADPDFGRWVIWTLAGKDFVCLEPWTAGANALNTGDALFELAPGEAKTLTMTIAVAKR